MQFIGSQGIVDTRRTPWRVNAPTQMLIIGHQSSGLEGFLFICPSNPFTKAQSFPLWVEEELSWIGSGFSYFLGDPPKPVQSHGPEQRAGPCWYDMGRNMG